MKMRTNPSRTTPRAGRPARLPRPVVWLALLAALAVAALGAIYSQARRERSAARQIIERVLAPAA